MCFDVRTDFRCVETGVHVGPLSVVLVVDCFLSFRRRFYVVAVKSLVRQNRVITFEEVALDSTL